MSHLQKVYLVSTGEKIGFAENSLKDEIGISCDVNEATGKILVTSTHRTILFDIDYDPDAVYKNSLIKKKAHSLHGGVICCSGEFLVTREDLKVSISTFFRSGEYKKFQYQQKRDKFFIPSAIAETTDFLALVISQNRVRIGKKDHLRQISKTITTRSFLQMDKAIFSNKTMILSLVKGDGDVSIYDESELKIIARLKSSRSGQQTLKSFAFAEKNRVLATVTNDNVDFWQLPEENEPLPGSLGFPLFSNHVNFTSVCQTVNFIEDKENFWLAIPKDDGFLIISRKDNIWKAKSVTIIQDKTSLLTNPFCIKYSGLLKKDAVFWCIATEKSTKKDVFFTIDPENQAVFSRKFEYGELRVIQAIPNSENLLIGSQNSLLSMTINGEVLVSLKITGSANILYVFEQNNSKFFLVGTTKGCGYLGKIKENGRKLEITDQLTIPKPVPYQDRTFFVENKDDNVLVYDIDDGQACFIKVMSFE